MKLRFMSDLHNEVSQFQIPVMDDEDGQILILAGDINTKYKAVTSGWLSELAGRFHSIFYVPGNHDYWRGSFDLYPARLKEKIRQAGLDNVQVLDSDSTTIDGIRIMGTTLWTNFGLNYLLLYSARGVMRDYKRIRDFGYARRLRPERVLERFFENLNFLKDELSKPGPCVVVTHHAPCELSIPSQFKGDEYSPLYYTHLFDLIEETKPLLWIHGHCHGISDYELAETRIVCNPRGYHGFEDVQGFNPEWVIEL